MEEKLLLEEIFSPQGGLAKLFGAFEVREGQQKMAEQVLEAYLGRKTALVEAGTGVGKSLAYLVPAVIWALRHQERTVISTHTIALQEQLLNKDIPFLLKAVDADLKAVLVKGMGNYLCLRKLQEIPDHPLETWAEEEAVEGSRSEIAFAIRGELWDQVKAESLSCTHVHCPHYKRCFFFKARKEAEGAQLLVVNHHLLLTDIALREKREENRSLLPSYSRLIVDEAHHLEETAMKCLSQRVDKMGLLRALAMLFSEKHREQLRHKLSDARYAALQHRIESDLPEQKTQLAMQIDAAFEAVKKLVPEGSKRRLRAEKNKLKESFHGLIDSLKAFVDLLALLREEIDEKSCAAEINALAGRLKEAAEMLALFFEREESLSHVSLAEGSLLSPALVETQLDVAEQLKLLLFAPLDSAVLCSATLAAGKNFHYVRSRLGIDEASEQIYDSPFDYSNRTLLAVPTDLPDPSAPQFLQQAVEQISEALEASQGNAFVLFTSYEMLRAAYDSIAPRHSFPFFKQQDASRSVLLERFKTTEGSVLFGTDSFWEGVDVPGDSLRCVIIAKLPFKVPSDPIEEAHREALLAQGRDPFMEKNLPEAIVKFKQGFGRLMRTKTDRGCILCLDKRLVTKTYGKMFLNSLPPARHFFAPRERVTAELKTFYEVV